MKTTPLKRVFMVNGLRLDDPNPALTPHEVRGFYANAYPDLTNADVQGPDITNGVAAFTFHRSVGTKG